MPTLSTITSFAENDPLSPALFNSKFDSMTSNIVAINTGTITTISVYSGTDAIASTTTLQFSGSAVASNGTYGVTITAAPASTASSALFGSGTSNYLPIYSAVTSFTTDSHLYHEDYGVPAPGFYGLVFDVNNRDGSFYPSSDGLGGLGRSGREWGEAFISALNSDRGNLRLIPRWTYSIILEDPLGSNHLLVTDKGLVPLRDNTVGAGSVTSRLSVVHTMTAQLYDGVLQRPLLKDYAEDVHSFSTVTTAQTASHESANFFTAIGTANVAFTMANAPVSGKAGPVTFAATASGSTVTFSFTSFNFGAQGNPGGIVAGTTLVVNAFTLNGGTTYRASYATGFA